MSLNIRRKKQETKSYTLRKCYPQVKNVTDKDETCIKLYDCVKIKSHDNNYFIGKVNAIWKNSQEKLQVSVIWFYQLVYFYTYKNHLSIYISQSMKYFLENFK